MINSKFNNKFNKREARFGWIDFEDDTSISSLLIDTVEKWQLKKE